MTFTSTWPYRPLLCLLLSSHLGNRSVQCANCSLWVHLSCSGLSSADFQKISLGHSWTCPMCPFFSQTSPSSFQAISLSSSINTCKTQKSSSLKMIPPKHLSSINNSPDLPNHPQLTFTYLPSASSIPPPLFLSHNLLSILFLPPKPSYESSNGIPMELAPVVLNLYNFFLFTSPVMKLLKRTAL